MLNIFKQIPNIETAIKYPIRFNNISKIINLNIKNIINYNLNNNVTVYSQHFLVKLLNLINVPLSLPDQVYYDNVFDKAVKISMSLEMTSIYYKGKIFNNEIYKDCKNEILYYHSKPFINVNNLINNWLEINPIKILHHEYSDINYSLNYKDNSSKLNIIVIDIALLALKYKAFLNDKNTKFKSANIFIAKHILPYMLYDHLDLCIFNQLYNKVLNINNNKIIYKSNIALINLNNELDKITNEILYNIYNSSKNYRVILHSIPSIQNENMYQTLLLPDTISCIQSDWSLCLSRLRAIDFLFKIGGKDFLSSSTIQINEICRSLKRNNVNQIINLLPGLDDYKNILNKILTI